MSEEQSIAYNNPQVYGYCDLRFPVTDLKKSLAFYCNVLGFEMNNPNQSIENKEVLIKLKRGSAPPIFLMEVEKEHFKPMHFMHNGRIWEAIEFMSQNICALRDRLKQAGAQVVREPEFNDFGTLTFYDPDGHYIKAVEKEGMNRVWKKLMLLLNHLPQLGQCISVKTMIRKKARQYPKLSALLNHAWRKSVIEQVQE